MTTCPWCGTTYPQFQSNCSRCGGPIQPAHEADLEPGSPLPVPPPAPRSIAPNFVWRLVFTDGWAIAAFVFLLLGGMFFLLGFGLTLGVITAFVGIPFAILGICFLAAGIPLFVWRVKTKQKTAEVLRTGQAAQGEIVEVHQNFSVRVNHQHPWIITYRFQSTGHEWTGVVSTLTPPGPQLQPGNAACILYLPDAPQNNALYPHP